MLRYCANCGTEVDETAVFCPTCGQPIEQDVESEIPPAPAWPDPEPPAATDDAAVPSAPPRPDHFRDDEVRDEASADREEGAPAAMVHPDEPTRVERRPEPAPEDARPAVLDEDRVDAGPAPPAAAGATVGGDRPRAGTLGERLRERAAHPPAAHAPAGGGPAPDAAPGADERRQPEGTRRPDLPITMPVTLSGWLLGVGAALAALGALFALFDGLGTAVDLLLLVTLLGLTATVFLANHLPAVPQLRLVTLVVVFVAFGVALDRLGFGRAGAGELLLFLGTAAAAMGAILVETGNDQPLGGPSA